MAVYYPNVVPVRLSDEDVRRTEAAMQKLQTPRSTLIRQVWREYLDILLEQPTENNPANFPRRALKQKTSDVLLASKAVRSRAVLNDLVKQK